MYIIPPAYYYTANRVIFDASSNLRLPRNYLKMVMGESGGEPFWIPAFAGMTGVWGMCPQEEILFGPGGWEQGVDVFEIIS